MQEEKKIGDLIRDIAHKYDVKLRFPVMSGKVNSYDIETMTVEVELSVDDAEAPTAGININVMLNNTDGVYMVPAIGANCLVAEVDGPGKWELLRASKYDKIVIQAGTLVQLNDGSKKGLVVLDELVSKINVLERDLNNIKAVFASGWVPVPNDGGAALKTAAASWAGSNITLTTGDDIENKKVTHG